MGKSRDEKGWLALARGRRTGETEMELMQAWSSLTTRTLPASLSHPPLIMSQSRSPSDTEEQHSSQTSLLNESASDSTPAADNNLCPNLDDEVSAARGAGAFVSLLPHTRSCCVDPMSCVDLAIPQKREREVSLEAATPHPDDTVRITDSSYTPFYRRSLTSKIGTRVYFA
jgi:hypothetical protein